jgi:hypothetical protein
VQFLFSQAANKMEASKLCNDGTFSATYTSIHSVVGSNPDTPAILAAVVDKICVLYDFFNL